MSGVTQASTAGIAVDGVRERLRIVQVWAGDLTAVALLVAMLVYSSSVDGGRPGLALLVLGAAALVAVPVAVGELARLPRWVSWWVLALAGGVMLSLAFAGIRAGLVRPTVVLGMTPVVFLATRRVLRRPWGAQALLVVLLLAMGRYWQRSFMQWWGATSGGQPQWLALSWHNQSGTLMAALGLLFGGLALTGRRLVALGGGLLAVAGLTGVWLSGSRGAVVLTALSLVLLVTAAWRSGFVPRWHVVGRAVALAAGSVALVVALTGMIGGAQPMAERDQGAAGNMSARLLHWQAAAGMFADQPIVGQGLGSYRWAAPAHTPGDANLTSSAHNEYLESLAGGGLLVGVPVGVAALAIGIAALGALRRPRRHADELRQGLTVGAVGMVAILGLHAGMDFDWSYPVLPALLAVGAALLVRDPSDDAIAGRSRRLPRFAAASLAVLLVGGVAATDVELGQSGPLGLGHASAAGWDVNAHAAQAAAALDSGDHEQVTRVTARALAWNPASERLRVLAAISDHRTGQLTARRLVETLSGLPAGSGSQLLVAEQLIHADELNLARDVLDDLTAWLAARQGWGVLESTQRLAHAEVDLAVATNGCATASSLDLTRTTGGLAVPDAAKASAHLDDLCP